MKILIIDDEADKREMLSALISLKCAHTGRSPPEYTYASTPEEGLAKAKAENFEVVFCDVDFEGCAANGLEGFVEPYCKTPDHSPVVSMSGNKTYAPVAKEHGASEFLHKGDFYALDGIIAKYILG